MIVIPILLLWRFGALTYLTGVARSAGQASPYEKLTEDIVLPTPKPAGSALILHGMNVEAGAMRAIGATMQKYRYLAYIPRLAGHRGVPEETLVDQSETWQRQVEQWARALPGPRVCVGYSMGAVLLLEAQLAGRIDCARMVLFAPALSTHIPDWVVALLRPIWPLGLRLPSAIPVEYRHFARTGGGTSASYFKILESLRRLALDPINLRKVPAGLVVLDERDQVVDAKLSLEFVARHFPTWRVEKVESLNLPERHAHHLPIDEKHVGTEAWARIEAAVGALVSDI